MKRSAILRRTPLRSVSKKRARESRVYTQKRKAFLAEHPWCECSPFLFDRQSRATEVHHREGRSGARYLDQSTWLAVSREAHRWLHANPSEARRRGWLT